MKTTTIKTLLVLIISIVLGYNFSIATQQIYKTDGDAYDYLHFGLSLAKTGNYGYVNASRKEFLEDFKNGIVESKSYKSVSHTAFRPPVWPLIISSIFLLFGYNLFYILVFKFILHLIGTYIFYKSLRLLDFCKQVVLGGVLLYGISPAWQQYSRVFLSEPITFFLITAWLYLLIKFLKHKKGLVLQGALGGIIVLSHPYYIFLPILIWILLFLNKKIDLKVLLTSSALLIAVISIWVIRNSNVFETDEIIITTSAGTVMAKGWNKDVPEEHTNTKGDLANEGLVLESFPYDEEKEYNEVEKMVLFKNAAINFVRQNTNLIIPIVGRKLLSAFNPFPETPKPGILEAGRSLFHLISLIAIVFVLVNNKNKIILSLSWGLIISTIGITILTYSGFRFRMPQIAIELLVILYCLDRIIKRTALRSKY